MQSLIDCHFIFMYNIYDGITDINSLQCNLKLGGKEFLWQKQSFARMNLLMTLFDASNVQFQKMVRYKNIVNVNFTKSQVLSVS